MNDKFLCGIVLGMLGGALIVTNCSKIRQAVKDGQNQLKQKAMDMSKKQSDEQCE